MKVRFKKLVDNAVIPIKAHLEDAGADLTATSKIYDKYGNVSYGTGIAVEIPKGYVGLLFPRSSVSKFDLSLCNAVGVVDSNYRGEILLKFKPTNIFAEEDSDSTIDGFDSDDFELIANPPRNCFRDYNIGDKIGQLIIMPYPEVEYVEVENLSESERGEKGFGSSGV